MAAAMRDRTRISKATIGYIAEQSEMPRWGQLGCNGFILLNAALKVVYKATPAFNDFGEYAFRRTETLLDLLLRGVEADAPAFSPGGYVQISGLASRQDLNGQIGVCVERNASTGRFNIRLLGSDQAMVAVKAANLVSVDPPPEFRDDNGAQRAAKT